MIAEDQRHDAELRCIDPGIGALITRYELGALDPAERESFVDHLTGCEFCHNEVYSMAPVMGVLRAKREAALAKSMPRQAEISPFVAAAASRPWWSHRALPVAASIILAVGIGLGGYILLRPDTQPGGGDRWAHVTVPKAPYTPSSEPPVLRGGDSGDLFTQGMEAYERDDYRVAAERLEVLCRLNPDKSEAHFYWGISLLLAGRSDQAVDPLRRAVERGYGEQKSAAHYYLALAFLKTGRVDRATAELQTVIDAGGSYKLPAEKLKAQVEKTRR